MSRTIPIRWKTAKLSEDCHCVLKNMRRDKETMSQCVSRLILFYSEAWYDKELETWKPEEAGVCERLVDLSDFGTSLE